MTSDKKIKTLKAEGWNIEYNVDTYFYEAKRGICIYKCKSITGLYRSIKTDFKQ